MPGPSPFRIPVDSRLPGGGGGAVSGIYNLNPNKVVGGTVVQDVAQLDRNFGSEPTENWHGVDLGVNARLRNGLTVQAGTSTGRTLQDNCGLRSALPETYPWSTITVTQSLRGDSTAGLTRPYCRIVEPFMTSFRGLATYVIPKVDIQVSGVLRSDPGNELAANYVVTNAIANSGPQPLGRDLSSGNLTVNLIPNATQYLDRRNNIDIRAAKILRFGHARTQIGIDIYNVTNSDTITAVNATYSPTSTTWQTPSTVATARYVKFNFQIDF